MRLNPETSQTLCAFFAATNLFFFLFNEDVINLIITVAMVCTVVILEFARNDYE